MNPFDEVKRLTQALNDVADALFQGQGVCQTFLKGSEAELQQQAVHEAHRIIQEALYPPAWQEWEGPFEAYSEQGYEGGHAMCVQDHRGITLIPDPYVPGHFQKRYSMNWLITIENGDILTVKTPTDQKVVFEGPVTRLRDGDYRYHFVPKEVDKPTWISWFRHDKPYICKIRRKRR